MEIIELYNLSTYAVIPKYLMKNKYRYVFTNEWVKNI